MTNEAAAKVEIGVAPDAKEVFGRRYQRFSHLVGELRAANEVKKQADEESKRLNKELQSMWADVEAKTVVDDGARVTLAQSSNSHISKERLLELGVTATVIRDATKVVEYSFVKVTEPKP
jgi:hypothetical protein